MRWSEVLIEKPTPRAKDSIFLQHFFRFGFVVCHGQGESNGVFHAIADTRARRDAVLSGVQAGERVVVGVAILLKGQ
jgi:hypothetical protein